MVESSSLNSRAFTAVILRQNIQAFYDRGTQTLADISLKHRRGQEVIFQI